MKDEEREARTLEIAGLCDSLKSRAEQGRLKAVLAVWVGDTSIVGTVSAGIHGQPRWAQGLCSDERWMVIRMLRCSADQLERMTGD